MRRRLPSWWMPVAATLLLGACTSRTLTIESRPPGAEVMLDNRRVGVTPVTVAFRHGGVHEILFFRPGYRPAAVYYDSSRLAYDVFPVDLLVDLGPWQAQDHQQVSVELQPDPLPAALKQDPEGVLMGIRERAGRLRRRAREIQLGATAPEARPPAETSGGPEGGRNP